MRDFVEKGFEYVGVELGWEGQGETEKGIVRSLNSAIASEHLKPGDVIIRIDPKYYRPTEVNSLIADTKKAKQKFNWEAKVKFKDLVKIMVDADLELKGIKSPGKGNRVLKKNGFDWTTNKLTRTLFD